MMARFFHEMTVPPSIGPNKLIDLLREFSSAHTSAIEVCGQLARVIAPETEPRGDHFLVRVTWGSAGEAAS